MPPSLRQNSSRGKKATIPASSDNPKAATKTASGGKRVREPEETIAEPETAPPKKARVTKNANSQPEPASGLRRSGRSAKQNSKTVTEKRKRRTKAEIEAARAAAEEAKRQKDEAAKKVKQDMAQMDIDDNNDKVQMAEKAVRRLSDMAMNDSSDPEGEEFVGFNEVSSTSDSASDLDDVEDLKESYKALQKQMEALQKKIGGGSKKRTGGGKKKSTKDVPHASGLLPDWNTRAAKVSKKSSHHINISSGGLDDEDADAVNPYSAQKAQDGHSKDPKVVVKSGQRDLSRRNELVAIVRVPGESDSESEEREPVKRTHLPKSSGRKATTETKVVPAIKIKSESKENAPMRKIADEDGSKIKKRHILNSNNVRINDLPDFAKDQTWRKTFLPTLYDKFFTSSNPFSQFAKGDKEFVSLLQIVIKEVYPNIKYKASASDSIHALAYNRINEKRSAIGSTAINLVKKHIASLEGANAARNWLLWASRGDGPLFFREPVAPGAPLDRRNPEYVKPGGKLLTKFLIDLVMPFLRLNSGSVSSNGHPRGLVALAMAALERAVQVLLRPSDDIGDFSSGSWGSKVTAYHKNLENIEETRWKELIDACGGGSLTPDSVDEGYEANLSFLDHNRAMLFDFSSPVKP